MRTGITGRRLILLFMKDIIGLDPVWSAFTICFWALNVHSEELTGKNLETTGGLFSFALTCSLVLRA